MISTQGAYKVALEPASHTAASTTTLVIDRLGFDYATIDVQLGSVSNASNVPTVISLSESDDTNSSNYATISGSTHTSNVTALPTTGVTVCTWDVTLIGRKRYLKVSVAPQATEVFGCIANLTRGELLPVTATLKNLALPNSWVVL